MRQTYKIVAYRGDQRWTVAKFIKTLEHAEAIQRRLYAANPGTDYYVE